jgi:WD40 repeat protein
MRRYFWSLIIFTLAFISVCLSVATSQTTRSTSKPPQPDLVLEAGHSTSISAIAFSPDNRWLASGDSGSLKVWDVSTGRELRSLPTKHDPTCISFSTDGRSLASVSWNGTVNVWELSTGHLLLSFSVNPKGSPVSAAFSRDGRWLASGRESIDIWDVATGRMVRTLSQSYDSSSITFSADGRWIASANIVTHFVTIWNVATGDEIRTLSGNTQLIWAVAYSPNGRFLAAADDHSVIRLWDAANGRELHTLQGPGPLGTHAIDFSPDGTWLATGSDDKSVRVWNVLTGQQSQLFAGHDGRVFAVAFSPDGNWLASAGEDRTIRLWDPSNGRQIRAMSGHVTSVAKIALSPDGRWLASANWDHSLRTWDLSNGRAVRALFGHSDLIHAVAFSSDGQLLASGGADQTIKIWEVSTGRELKSLSGHTDSVTSIAFSPDGQWLACGDTDIVHDYDNIKIFEMSTGLLARTLRGHSDGTNSIAFSPDGRWLASAGMDEKIRIWEVSTGRQSKVLSGLSDYVTSIVFSPDGRLLASGGDEGTVKLWEASTGHEVRTISANSDEVSAVAFSHDGLRLASASWDGAVRLWEVSTGRELKTYLGHTNAVNAVVFNPDGRFLISGGEDGTVRIWNVATGAEVAMLAALDKKDWAIIGTEGRFDASEGGMDLVHWVVAMEPISLNQLKKRYFEPRLVAKLLGFDKEPLRHVGPLKNLSSYPDVTTLGSIDPDGKLRIRIRNRGGGIGKVQVLVNGKEFSHDARGTNANSRAAEITLTVDLSKAPLLRGRQNEITVFGWDGKGEVSSRGIQVVWSPPGAQDEPKPELWAIVSGISDYASADIRLNFAAKDAEDMAFALTLGGSRLFGPEHVHLTLFSSTGKPGTLPATKANLELAFESAQKSRAGDVLLVYLSGHGVTTRGEYVYPTQEASTLDFSDPAIQQQSSVTSEELVDWIKKIPATHQVMILDTCAAGAAAAKLIEKRESMTGDQIRALDRLKDRTGFHVLMGSAADAASYEASQYGQGLLTYVLLQGMKGAALKNDVDVDVSPLFQYAVDNVPRLARNLGGIQAPELIAPLGASFDIGQLFEEDKERIPLAKVKPLILRPLLINPGRGSDNLGLMAAVRKQLREKTYVSFRGNSAQPVAVFVDADEMPGAVLPSGTYSVEGGQVRVNLVLSSGTKESKLQINGSEADVPSLGARIADAIIEASASLSPPPS